MKKIISGLLGIMMVTAVVGGTAYALFTATATVNGINITTGSAGLTVEDQVSYDADLDLNNLYPGYQASTTVDVKNTSTSAIALNVVAQLTSAGGDWGTLKDVVYMRVTGSGDTGWKTLAEWNASPITLPGGSLAQAEVRTYTVMVYVDVAAGNGIANKSLTDVTFTLTGTQVAP